MIKVRILQSFQWHCTRWAYQLRIWSSLLRIEVVCTPVSINCTHGHRINARVKRYYLAKERKSAQSGLETFVTYKVDALPQRYLRKDMVLFLFQTARLEGRILLAKCPFLRSPRCWRPAEVRPRNSRCFIVGAQIQFNLASFFTAVWEGSTMITSKNLYVESSFTQYEFSTRNPPQRRPARSSATLRRLRANLSCVIP